MHQDLFGLRETKYRWLNKHSINSVKWKKFIPKSEFYLFVPRDEKLLDKYNHFLKVTDVFQNGSNGLFTARDSFVIDFEKKKLEKRIEQFIDPKIDEDILKQTYGLTENKSWRINEQRIKLQKERNWKD